MAIHVETTGILSVAYGEYGHEITNPIPARDIREGYEYLEKLRTSDGTEITYQRIGSMEAPNITDIIDGYTIYANEQKIATLYICPYAEQTSTKAPTGFMLIENISATDMLHIKYQLRDIGRGYTSIKGIMDRYPEISQKEQIVQIYAKAKHLMLPEKMPKNKAVAVLVREGCDIDLAGNICDEIEKHFYPRKQRPTNIFGKVWRYIRNKRLIIIYMKGRKYTNSGKYKQAVACYEKAINMAPNIPDAYHFMGNCYVLQEHYRQAIDYYEQAIENFNNHESSYLALSICYQELGDTERSVTCLVKALKNSNDGHIYGILSFVKLGMYEEAIACCKTALGLKPHDESLTSHICNVLTIADSSMRHGTDKTDEQAPE